MGLSCYFPNSLSQEHSEHDTKEASQSSKDFLSAMLEKRAAPYNCSSSTLVLDCCACLNDLWDVIMWEQGCLLHGKNYVPS